MRRRRLAEVREQEALTDWRAGRWLCPDPIEHWVACSVAAKLGLLASSWTRCCHLDHRLCLSNEGARGWGADPLML